MNDICFDKFFEQKKNLRLRHQIRLSPIVPSIICSEISEKRGQLTSKIGKKEDVGKIPRISLHLSFVRIIDI